MLALAPLLLAAVSALAQPQAQALLGRARALRDRPDEALDLAEKALLQAREPAARLAAERLVRDIRLDLGDVAGARAALGTDVSTDTLALALSAVGDGRRGEARAQAQRLVAQAAGGSPEDRADALRQEAQILRQLGDDAAAETSLEGALSAVPEYGPALRMLTEIRVAQGRPADAVGYIDRVFRSPEKTPLERADAGAREGELLLSLGRPDAAEKVLAGAEAALAGRPRVLSALAGLRAAQGRRADAARLADRLARMGGSPLARGDALLRAARVRRALGDDAGAEKALRAALEAAPARGAAAAELCDLLLSRGKVKEALALTSRAVELSSGAWPSERAAALANRARVEQAAGDDAAAEKSLRSALEADPSDRDALRALAGALLALKRPAEALPLAERLGERELAARARLALGDGDGARRDYERALTQAPDDSGLLTALASLALARERPEDALDPARRLVAASDGAAPAARARAHELLARVLLALDDADAARAEHRLALAAAPGDPDALGELAALELDHGDPHAALAPARKLVETAPAARRAGALQLLARAQRAAGDAAGEEKSLARVLELAGSDRDALRSLANARLAAGQAGGAVSLAERLVAISSGDADARLLLGRARLAAGDRAGAADAFGRAGGAEAWGALADMALEDGRFADALALTDRQLAALASGKPGERAYAYRRKARASQKSGDAAGVRAALAAVLENDPQDLETLGALAADDAPAAALERITRAAPGPEPARRAAWLVQRGEARARAGDDAGARGDYAAAVALDARAACFGPGLPKRRERLSVGYFDLCLERFPGQAVLRSDREVAAFMAGKGAKRP